MREKLPRIAKMEVLPDHCLEIRFGDGWDATVCLRAFIADFPSLSPLNDPALFARAATEEWGSGVTWDEEGPLSIAATTLYRLAAQQAGDDSRIFDAWMARHGLSNAKAADILGMTRRTIINYRTGNRPIPKVVMLACRAIDLDAYPKHQAA